MLLTGAVYSFQCTRCGRCCCGNKRVRLDPYDLWKMAVFYGYKTTEQLFRNNLVIYRKGQHDMVMPYIRFKKKPFRFCPFLINECDDTLRLKRGLCALHPNHKPLVCSMAPVGREIDVETGIISYLLTPPAQECPGMQISHNQYIDHLRVAFAEELDYEERYFRILHHISQLPEKAWSEIDELYFFGTETGYIRQLEKVEKRYILRI
jgi:Fe-S-cluster containining protein